MQNRVCDQKGGGREVFQKITLDHKRGGGESSRGPKLIMRYLNSPLKNGKTRKYQQASSCLKRSIAAAEHYLSGKLDALKESKPGKTFKVLKNMGAQPCDCTDNPSFTLPNNQALK